MDAAPAEKSKRLLWLALLVLTPLAVLLGVCWYAAESAARVWPVPELEAPEAPAAAFDPCPDGLDRLEAMMALPVDVADPELDAALDGLLSCGGLDLASPETVSGGPTIAGLRVLAQARLVDGHGGAEAVEPAAVARDFAAVLTYAAFLEQSRGSLAVSGLGLELGLETLRSLELWLEQLPLDPEALALLAEALEPLVALPSAAPASLAWECRDAESRLLELGGIPAPAILLEPAGVPLWVGWAAQWLPGATVYDASRTLAMHRHRCGLQIDAVAAGGGWGGPERGPSLWDPQQLSLGRALDNPLGRATLEDDKLVSRANDYLEMERRLRSRRALLATRVAVERGSLAHDGLLPLQLELLVPDYLPAAPVDPVDGRPLNWVRSHGEIFTSREEPTADGGKQRLLTRVPER
jgi:hypothetical protein